MNILIIKPSSLGDVIHALPFLKAIKDRYPDSRVDWVISRRLKGIIEDNPLIDELIVIDKDSWGSIGNLSQTVTEIFRTARNLRKKHYDIIADLQGLLRSGIISFITPAVLKIGFDNAREGSRYFYNKRVSVNSSIHAVEKNLKIAGALGAKPEKTEFPLKVDEKAREEVKRLINNAGEYILIIPSARWRTKIWPAENFASLIKRLPVTSVITGSPDDKDIARKITDKSPNNTIDICGRTGLKELVALIEGAKVVVSGDSGPIHIAAALGKPVIALFGPTDASKTGPYGWQENKDLTVISSNVSCSPCFRKRCRDPICMSGITVETVLEELNRYIK